MTRTETPSCPSPASLRLRASLGNATSPDATRELGRVGVRDCASIDVKQTTRFLNWQLSVQKPEVEGESIGVAGQEGARAEADGSGRDAVDVVEDRGRAVVAERAVEFGLHVQLVGTTEDVLEECARLGGCG